MESSLLPLEDKVLTTGLPGKSFIFLFLPNSLHHLRFSPSSPTLPPTPHTYRHRHTEKSSLSFLRFYIHILYHTRLAVELQSFHLSEAAYTFSLQWSLLPLISSSIDFLGKCCCQPIRKTLLHVTSLVNWRRFTGLDFYRELGDNPSQREHLFASVLCYVKNCCSVKV